MKPTTEEYNKKAMKIFDYLKSNRRYCSKEELGEVIRCNERVVRDMINYLRNKGAMICSVSTKKGYKLISSKTFTEEDFEDVKHMWMEIDHRQIELESMKKCCDRYFKNVEKNKKAKESK